MEAPRPTRQQLDIISSLNRTLGAFRPAPSPYADAQAPAALAGRRKNPRALIVAASRVRTDLGQVRQKDRGPTSERIQELARSIAAVGLQQPPGVREAEGGMYEVVYGEGRFVAMTQVLGWQEVEVIRVDVKEEDLVWHQLHENVHRTNLDPLDLAQAVARAVEQGHSRAQVAERMGKSESWVQKAVTVSARLSGEARETLANSEVRQAMDAVYAIAQVPEKEQAAVAREVVERKLGRRETEALAAAARERTVTKEGPPARGRKKARFYETTLRAGDGASVTVKFRKAEVAPEEVARALEEALKQVRE